MLAIVAAADSASTVRKNYSVFIYSEAEPHAMYAIYKQTLTLCVLHYIAISALSFLVWLEVDFVDTLTFSTGFINVASGLC